MATVYLANGVRLGLMRGQRWVKRLDDLYLDPAKKAVSGPGQEWSADHPSRVLGDRRCWYVHRDHQHLRSGSLRTQPQDRPQRQLLLSSLRCDRPARLAPGWPDLQRDRQFHQPGLHPLFLRSVRPAGRSADRRGLLFGRSLQWCFGQRSLGRGRHVPQTPGTVGQLYFQQERTRDDRAGSVVAGSRLGVIFRTRMDWFQYPQFRTFTASVEIAF